MIKKEIEKVLKTGKENWRDINNYQVGDIIAVKYQYAGVGIKIRKFVGICIGKRKKGIGSQLILRNVIGETGVEILIYLESNKIILIQKIKKSEKIKKSKIYYLRNKSLSKSKVN